MRKKDELSQEHACLQRAHAEEMVFVLMSRDSAAPAAIRAWIAERLRLGKNSETDTQIIDALECARVMEMEGGLWSGPFPGLSLDEAERRYREMVEVDNG